MLNIMLTGYIEKLEGRVAWRARVEGIGVHAYGKTNDEARQRAETMTRMAIELWSDFAVLEGELERCEIPFWRDDEIEAGQGAREFHMDVQLAYA